MRYQFLRASYQSDGTIKAFVRGEDGRKYEKSILGFKSYFYVPAGSYCPPHVGHLRTEVGFTSIFGEQLYKIVMNNPDDVGKKDMSNNELGYRRNFVKHYEANVKFIRRLLIDTGIKSGFECSEQSEVYYTDLKPCDFQTVPSICFIDCEILTKWRFPDPNHANEKVIAISVWDSIDECYFTFLLWDKKQRVVLAQNHVLLIFEKEEDLFQALRFYAKKVDPDIISGWNVFFDLDYLRARAKKYGIFDLGFDRCLQFDLLTACRRVLGKGSYSLKDFVVDDGIAKTEELVAEEFHAEMYDEDKMKFVHYNKDDVRYCVEIDKKHNLIKYFWEFKNYIGLEDLNATLYHSTKIDTFLLRVCSGRFALPSGSDYEDEDKEGYSGAYVYEPKIGIHEGVAEFDMSKYYPNIVLAWKLSPEKENGIICELVRIFMKERERYDALLSRYEEGSPEYNSFFSKWQVVKDLLNSIYGYIGYKHGRLYDKEKAEMVTTKGREGLQVMEEVVGRERVIAGDTDGLKGKVQFSEAESVAQKINTALVKWCKEQGVEPLLRVKFEKYYRRIVFVRHKGDERGAKKRYAAHVVWEKGKVVDYVFIRGFDTIRRDSSRVTRIMQRRVLEILARGETTDIAGYIRETIEHMRCGDYTIEDIAIQKTLSKRIDDYDPVPSFVRGAIYSNMHLGLDIRGGDMIKMIYVKNIVSKPQTDVVSFFDGRQLPKDLEIDMKAMVEKTVKAKVENIIELVGIKWESISGEYVSLREAFA